MTGISKTQSRFLSTPSGWRATHAVRFKHSHLVYFYPRPPGGGRRNTGTADKQPLTISIHALRVEGDNLFVAVVVLLGLFLSTPSGWRATFSFTVYVYVVVYFYPRPPGGGRPAATPISFNMYAFLSTPSGWRATQEGSLPPETVAISIHALRVEGDGILLVRIT